jgi:hypothetical protein
LTSLLAWVSVDSRGISALNFISDSQISWTAHEQWEGGQKLFCSTKQPCIFGYTGDVIFPVFAINSLVDLIDHLNLITEEHPSSQKIESIFSHIKKCFVSFPGKKIDSFNILCGLRDGVGVAAEFRLYLICWTEKDSFSLKEIATKKTELKESISRKLISLGTGQYCVDIWLGRWRSSELGTTSRAIYNAFCDSIICDDSHKDIYSGGPPQFISLYRKHAGKTHGIITNHGYFYRGICFSKMDTSAQLKKINWFNLNFELCDFDTGIKKDGSKLQPRPKAILK